MSVQALSWVLDHSAADGLVRLVLISIANHAKKDGTGAWPSVETIAQEAHVSERTVHRAIAELKAMKELAIDYKAGPYGTNIYKLPRLSQCQPVTVPPVASDPAIAVAPNPSLTVLNNKKSKRATAWPIGFALTEELRAFAVIKGVADPDEMWNHFADHHRSKGAVFKDWPAAWRTWVRNSKRFTNGKGANETVGRRQREADRAAAEAIRGMGEDGY